MSRRIDAYKIKTNDNLGNPAFWNARFADIDNRLGAVEDYEGELQTVVDSLTALALARLNDTFLPLINEAQSRLNSLAVSFSAEALTSLACTAGTKVFTLTDATAANYVYTDYITARAASAPDNTMTGQVVSFDRTTKHLTVAVDRVTGDAGTYGDWLIRVGYPPGSNHETDYDNPHHVTAEQVGAYTIDEANVAIVDAIVAAVAALALQSASQHPASDFATADHSHNIGDLTGTVAFSNIATSAFADAAAMRALTASKLISTDAVIAGNAYVAGGNLTGAVALNFANFVNVAYTLTGDVTLTPGTIPTALVGTSGVMEFTEDATGNRNITWGSGFKFSDGIAPAIDKSSGRVNTINYHIRSTSLVYIGLAFHGVR